jgi:alanyl-tRNA synthetase
MTQKLYLDRPYDTVFEAAVVSSRPLDAGESQVVLDRTLFYPESGGQLPDGGTLGDAPVANVQEADGDTVVHTVRGGFEAGHKVVGTIDWTRRFDHMQQHTGQHVLSRAFIQTAGLHTVSFHMGDETCTIDLEGGGFGEDAVRQAEDVANRIIEENRPVDITTVPLEELDRLDLRRKVPEGVSEARIVSVRDFDMIPCCGTHVRSTGELGLVKVLKGEKVKGFQRVHFKAGLRALEDYREKHTIVQALSNRLTTGTSEVLPRIERLIDDAQAGARRARLLTERLAGAEKARLLEGAANAAGVRVLSHREADPAYVRALATALQAETGVVAILGADDGSVVCVASRDLTVDLAGGAAEIARELGGAGGGKGGFVQLKLADGSRVDELMRRMETHVRTRLS